VSPSGKSAPETTRLESARQILFRDGYKLIKTMANWHRIAIADLKRLLRQFDATMITFLNE